MTVINQVPINQYISTNGQTVFSGTFEILEDTDVAVYKKPADSSADDTTDLLTLDADYTVSGAGVDTEGFTVTLLEGADTDDVITLLRAMPFVRSTSFNNGGSFQAADFNLDYDAQVLMAQQVNMLATRKTPKYLNSELVQTKDLSFPQLNEGQCWRMNGANTGIEAVDFEDNDPGAAILRADLASHNADEGASLIGTVGGDDTVEDFIELTNPSRFHYPVADGSAGQFIQTDGDGTLSFANALPPGAMIDWAGSVAPTGWFLTDGMPYSRVTYAALFTNITFMQGGTLSGTTTITGLSSTAYMFEGMSLEGTGIPASTEIATIAGPTSITINNSATISGSSVLRFFPWGNGNGSTTFNVPDCRGRSPIGSGIPASPLTITRITGTTDGEEKHTQTESELVGHIHTVTNLSPGGDPDYCIGAGSGGSSLDISGDSVNAGFLPDASFSIASTGGGMGFNVVHPVYVATRIIKT